MRFFIALFLLTAFVVNADYISTNQAVTEVSAAYPGAVLSADYIGGQSEVQVRLLSPAGLVHKLLVCKQNSAIKIKELSGENTSSRRSSCNTLAAKN